MTKKYQKLFFEKTYFKVRSGTNGLKEKKITPLGVCDGDEVEIIFAPGGLLLRGVQDTQVRKGKAMT